uniref:HAT C-terminal dimerisation domain-containing protein n=1 Tax=Bactrocera dorsalis TaxID=27457 RepID=A0A034WRC0_BACDO
MVRIISYILSLPGTSATVERVFSLINQIWSDEKSQIKIETLRDLLYVRYNIKMTCKEFFEFLKMQPKMLKEIASNEKYAFKNAKQINENKNKYAEICMQKNEFGYRKINCFLHNLTIN